MGLGAAFATAFAAEGAAVGLLDPNEEELEATVAAIAEAGGGKPVPIVGDVSKTEAAERAVSSLVSEFGGLDVLVNNAGVVRYGEIPAFPEEDWDFVLDTNLKGMYQTARFAIPEFRKRGKGAIVNVASVQAYWSHQGAVAYSASKGGVVAFTRALALDHAHEGIRVNAVAPGSVLTPMLHHAAHLSNPENPDAALAEFAQTHPIRRLIQPEDVANVVLFLASDKAGVVTGITVPVDGGILSGNVSWDIDAGGGTE
jgi:NAD(P)-dependent dehydrogenase (short-subunit alcohol dehydrogenase family)